MALIGAVLAGFVVAALAPGLHHLARRRTAWLLALLPLSLTVYFAAYIPAIAAGETRSSVIPWAPSLGVVASFSLDGLSLLFALLITGIGTLIVLYSGGYLAGERHEGRFHAYLLLFMGSMLGVVLADNVLTLYVFWELTSVTSYLLIGFHHEDGRARAAALQALLVTTAGGLALLAGLILLGEAGGSFELSTLATRGDDLRAAPLYLATVTLVMFGAATKSAQVPFHFWLPNAMQAPTPVSAYLHSATMVKAGVYVLARLTPALGGTVAWQLALVTLGGITMVTGAYLAMTQRDAKRMLAYATMSVLGVLVLMLGIGTEAAIEAAIVYLMAHAFYKGALFLVAGIVDHEAGTRDVDNVRGLGRAMPITAAAAGVAALSMAGLPPFLGYVGKELLYAATTEMPWAAWATTGAVLFAGLAYVALGAVIGIRPFVGRHVRAPEKVHEPPTTMWLGAAVLAVASLCGAMPTVLAPVVSPAVSSILQRPHAADLHLWHGWTPPLILSVATVLLGLAAYAARDFIQVVHNRARRVFTWGPERLYEGTMQAVTWLATLQTAVFQSGYLRAYLHVTLLTAFGGTAYTLWRYGAPPTLDPARATDVRVYEAALALLILVAAAVVVSTSSRLGAVAALGVVGYGVALLFVLFGAPDLAITQFLIETLMVILFVQVLYHLPEFSVLSSRRVRVRDALIAATFGGIMTVLVLVVTGLPHDLTLSRYFIEQSIPLGHGHNVVNVILVDFRGLDTLGEITVLAGAGFGIYTLLKLRHGRGEERPQ